MRSQLSLLEYAKRAGILKDGERRYLQHKVEAAKVANSVGPHGPIHPDRWRHLAEIHAAASQKLSVSLCTTPAIRKHLPSGEAMSKGPGRVERTIIAAFNHDPHATYTLHVLADLAYPNWDHVEIDLESIVTAEGWERINVKPVLPKKYEVAVLRAARNACRRTGWECLRNWRATHRPGGLIWYNPRDEQSFISARKYHWRNAERLELWRDEVRARNGDEQAQARVDAEERRQEQSIAAMATMRSRAR